MDVPDCPNCQALRRRLAELEAQLKRLCHDLDEQRRAGKRQAAPFRKGPPKPNPKRPGRKAGDQHGTHGHRPPPQPPQIDEVLDAPLPDACPDCGGTLTPTGTTVQFPTEIPRRPVHRQFTIHVGCCDRCRRRVQGRHPLQTSDATGAAASQLGADAQAAVVTLNKEMGLSHAKVARTFATLFGIDLTRGASAQVVLRAADRLQPAYQEIVRDIQDADQLWLDETGWRLGGRPAWLHVWVSDRATCYTVNRRRSADVLEGVIGRDWQGTLIHDGFASYDRFATAIHQQCLFHVLRRAREQLARATRGAVRFPRQVIALFTDAIHLRNEHLAGRAAPGVWADARDRYEERLLALLARPRTVEEQATLADHLWNHFPSWFSFLSDTAVPPTNALGEQAVRPAVVNRKVYGGNRTASGAAAQGVLTSVLRTCRQQGLAAVDFASRTLRAFGNRLLPTPTLLATR
jgi:transposase